MRLRGQVRGGAGQLCEGEQSREDSRSNNPGPFQAQLQTLIQANPFRRKLNRQIAELEPALSLRKQTTANCSNRQKIQFCKHEISTQKLSASSKNSSLAEESRPQVSNRELTMRRASAFRASNATRGICFALSNRELLELEILQLAENKRPRPVLIANFEPIHFPVFPPGRSR